MTTVVKTNASTVAHAREALSGSKDQERASFSLVLSLLPEVYLTMPAQAGI
jgi:hypothetical protein